MTTQELGPKNPGSDKRPLPKSPREPRPLARDRLAIVTEGGNSVNLPSGEEVARLTAIDIAILGLLVATDSEGKPVPVTLEEIREAYMACTNNPEISRDAVRRRVSSLREKLTDATDWTISSNQGLKGKEPIYTLKKQDPCRDSVED